MHQATVLWIVLTLLAGPHAGVLCKAWCDPQEAARTGCHHDDTGTSARLTGNNDCGDAVLSSAFLVTENVRRGVSDQNVHRALVVPRFRFPLPTGEARRRRTQERGSPLESRPLVTALRI